MKTILVLTDFSENALRAAETAATLAEKLNANLLLFNANYTVPAVPYYPGVILVNENISWETECEKKLNQLAEHLKQIVSEVNVGQRKPSVQTLLLEGDLWGNVRHIMDKENVEMIIMGGRSGSTIDHVVYGSDISAIIDHATCPVLVISSNMHLTMLNRVIFATDFNESDRYAITYLMELGKLFEYQLEIVHVSLYGDRHVPQDPLVFDFIKMLEEPNYPNLSYTDIGNKDFIQGLSHICEERGADLLALTHQQHSYLARVFKEGAVKKLITKQKLPLLIFSSGMQHKHDRTGKKPSAG